MLPNTGTPSAGQPVPVSGWQNGEELGRRPTRVTPFAPTTVPPGITSPPEPALYGRCSPCEGIVVPGGTKNSESAAKGPQVSPGPPGKLRTPGIAAKSKHVCAV